jgi:peptidyl-prolyl cis-trans isomerase A (cyclophilin A)
MARTNDPDSATTQFFINVVDNSFLDPGEASDAGYAVFAEVTSGMDVIDAMGIVATDSNDAPLQSVLIENAERL